MSTKSRSERLHLSRWAPIAAMILLMIVLGAYTNSRNPAFLSSFTLNNLLVATMPLALAAMGQTSALMVRAFDVSVGALTTLCLVVASFVLTPDSGWGKLIFGMLIVLLVAMAVACVNVVLIRVLKLSSIIATLATYSILFGISLRLRHQPGGHISDRFTNGLLTRSASCRWPSSSSSWSPSLPTSGCTARRAGSPARATGLDEESAKRRGVRVGFLFVRAFFIVAAAAAVSSYFMATNAQIGDPNYGIPYTLTSISAAVLGGASLLGGRGSFLGAVVGALFVNMITTVLPFLGWSNPGQIAIGVLTLLALSFYQAPELLARTAPGIPTSDLRTPPRAQPSTPRSTSAMDPVQRLLAHRQIG